MPDSRIIETTRPSTVVTPVVKIDGVEIARTFNMESIVVEKAVNLIASARVVFIDGDSASGQFEASNETLFIPGKEIEITCGYESDTYVLFKGVIIKHAIKIRTGSSKLIIECRDKAVAMTLSRRNKYFPEDTKDSDAISEIARGYSGLSTDIETTDVSHKNLVQYEASDWDFIVNRAEMNGKLVYTDDGTLVVKKPDLSQGAALPLTFGATILELDAEIDARNQHPEIKSRSWTPADQVIDEAEAQAPSELNGNLTVGDLANVFSDEISLNHGGNIPQQELKAWADTLKLKQVLSKVSGRVRFKGVHTLKPGMLVELNRLSERFNGKAFVSGIQHTIVAGNWQLDAQLGLDTNWFTEKFETSIKPASALIPAVSGLQIGLVSQLESDPDSECRILVRLPIISPDEQGIWARVATLDAGEERGSFFLPEVGDEVIVGFLNDDPRQPVVLGMLNSSAKPAPLRASDDNHEKGIVTRSKMKVIFNDDKKSVVIETPAGKKITMDEDAGLIKLEDDHSNAIIMDSDGITIETQGKITLKAQKDLEAEGMNVNLKANTGFTAEGSASLEAKSSGTTTIKGSIVQIN